MLVRLTSLERRVGFTAAVLDLTGDVASGNRGGVGVLRVAHRTMVPLDTTHAMLQLAVGAGAAADPVGHRHLRDSPA